jgi:hypothetical protein
MTRWFGCGFHLGFGGELFSLIPTRLACYPHDMDNGQDGRYSRDPLAIGRLPLRAEIDFDGTKLPLVVGRLKTATGGI